MFPSGQPLTDDYYVPDEGYDPNDPFYRKRRQDTSFQGPSPLSPLPDQSTPPNGGFYDDSAPSQPSQAPRATAQPQSDPSLYGDPEEPTQQTPVKSDSPAQPSPPPQPRLDADLDTYRQAVTGPPTMGPAASQLAADIKKYNQTDPKVSPWRQVLAGFAPPPLQPLVAMGPSGMKMASERRRLAEQIKLEEPLATLEERSGNQQTQRAEQMLRLSGMQEDRDIRKGSASNTLFERTLTNLKDRHAQAIGTDEDPPEGWTKEEVKTPDGKTQYFAVPSIQAYLKMQADSKTNGMIQLDPNWAKQNAPMLVPDAQGRYYAPSPVIGDLTKAKPEVLTKDQADRMNATWDPILKTAKLPTGQFTPGMSKDDSQKLLSSLNDTTSRLQGQQRINIAMDRGDPQYEREYTAVRNNLQKNFETYEQQRDRIAQARQELSEGIVGQAIGTIKFLSSLASGQGSGVRITQAELNSITKARSLGGSFEAWVGGLAGTKKLSAEQVKQMNTVLDDVSGLAGSKEKLYSDTMDRLGNTSNREQVRKVESDFRASLLKGTPPKPASIPKGAKAQYDTISGQWRYQTAKDQPWQIVK